MIRCMVGHDHDAGYLSLIIDAPCLRSRPVANPEVRHLVLIPEETMLGTTDFGHVDADHLSRIVDCTGPAHGNPADFPPEYLHFSVLPDKRALVTESRRFRVTNHLSSIVTPKRLAAPP